MIYLISVVLTNRNLKGLFEFFEMKIKVFFEEMSSTNHR